MSKATKADTIEKTEDLLKVKAGKEPDESQKAVIRKTDNAVVSAGAGSGKTEVLATRFAYLLMTDSSLHVKNILAITFTKKAAAEIYARVFLKLNQYKRALSLPENTCFQTELENVKRALKEFSEAKVQTLDSYSKDIVSLAAARYGIRPDFNIGGGGNDVEKKALVFALSHKDNPSFRKAYESYCAVGNMEGFARDYLSGPIIQYTTVATKDGWFCKNFENQKKIVVDTWNKCMAVFRDNWESLREVYSVALTAENMTEGAEKIRKGAGEILQKYPYGECWQNLNPAIFDKPDEMKQCIRTVNEVFSAFAAIPYNSSKNIKDLYQEIKKYKISEPKTESSVVLARASGNFMLNHEAQFQMHSLLDMFLSEVNADKKIKGSLTFKDIAELSLLILEEQNDIRDQQKKIIRKIMIDEFQDNNARNRDMLFLISEEDGVSSRISDFSDEKAFYENLQKNISREKLFFVGDEKQSIYKFRGADVSVFNGLKSSLQDREGNVLLAMNNNYRSHLELLKAFNGIFGDDRKKLPTHKYDIPSIFYYDPNSYAVDADGKDSIPSYEAKYLECNYARKNPAITGGHTVDEPMTECRIHACILNDGKNSSDDDISFADFRKEKKILDANETLAYFIARKIHQLHTEKDIPLGAFAILDNSRTHRTEVQKYLDKYGIPYKVDVQKGIFREAVVNDFYNFLRICIYPSDTNAFASFLASPFAGLSPAGVENVMAVIYDKNNSGKNVRAKDIADESEETELQPDFSAFSRDFPVELFDLSKSDAEKYCAAWELYNTYRIQIMSSGITSTVENLWYKTGYFYELKKDKSLALYEEQFDLLYEIARSAEKDGRNISWFVDQLALVKNAEYLSVKDNNAEIETSDVHYPLERNESVSIMTIHQSKGLEFDYVFVTGIFDNPESDKQTAVFYSDDSGVSLRTLDGEDNLFFMFQSEESKKKELAEQKRKIYVALTRARQEVFLVGALSKTENLTLKTNGKTGEIKYSDNGNPSIMHKLIRYYYVSEKGLYQDNDFSDKGLDPENWFYEPYFNENAPFDFIKINAVSINASLSGAKNGGDYEEQREKVFACEENMEEPGNFPVFIDKTSSPSGLEKIENPAEEVVSQTIAGWKKNPAYDRLNEIVSVDFTEEITEETEDFACIKDFNRGTFGTMAHAYLEHWVKTGELENTEKWEQFPGSVKKLLFETYDSKGGREHDELSEICKKMVSGFSESEPGKNVIKAKKRGAVVKAEYGFKMDYEGTVFTGSIDLFYQNEDGTFTIVDYKTDDNAKGLHPERYFAQQACYRRALSLLYGVDIKKIKCVLYFLRFDAWVEITSACREDLLSQTVDKLDKEA